MATTSSSPKNDEQLQAQTRLTRTIEASLKIAVPDPEEIRFRSSLFNCATAQIDVLKDAFVIRMYEAACDVKFPSDEVTSFRKALQNRIGKSFDLRRFRQAPNPQKP